MDHSARLLVNTRNFSKSLILWNDTELYYKQLRAAYLDIQKNKKSEYLNFSFFTLCAATLEYSLNYILADFCITKFGPDDYKQYADAYISMKLSNKLKLVPNIVSEGVFVFNEDNPSYKKICELITLRNQILHNKEYLKEISFPDIAKSDLPEELKIVIKKQSNPIERLTSKECLNFGKALGELKKGFMMPYFNDKIVENKLIRKV